MAERLDKVLSSQNYGSRKEIAAMAKQGRVTVNGEIVKNPAQKVEPEQDVIAVDGTAVSFQRFVYYMLHKPAGVLSAAILAVVLFMGARGEAWAAAADMRYSLAAADEEERLAFLGQFGWKVETEPVAVEEVVIPVEFNDVYQNYNDLQQEQGLDLTPYTGKTCKRWVYQVLNYPREGERVLATLLVYDGRIIGGDISSASLDGFMATFLGEHGLMEHPSGEEPSSAPAETSSRELPAAAYPTE